MRRALTLRLLTTSCAFLKTDASQSCVDFRQSTFCILGSARGNVVARIAAFWKTVYRRCSNELWVSVCAIHIKKREDGKNGTPLLKGKRFRCQSLKRSSFCVIIYEYGALKRYAKKGRGTTKITLTGGRCGEEAGTNKNKKVFSENGRETQWQTAVRNKSRENRKNKVEWVIDWLLSKETRSTIYDEPRRNTGTFCGVTGQLVQWRQKRRQQKSVSKASIFPFSPCPPL